MVGDCGDDRTREFSISIYDNIQSIVYVHRYNTGLVVGGWIRYKMSNVPNSDDSVSAVNSGDATPGLGSMMWGNVIWVKHQVHNK